jgi:hypothetical protein
MKKINILLLINGIILFIVSSFQMGNLKSCFETAQYHVWICNTGVMYFTHHILTITMGILIIIKLTKHKHKNDNKD